MNTHDDFDLLLARWLDASAPVRPPVAAHDEAMVSVRRARQHARWSAVVRAGFDVPAAKPTIRLITFIGVAAMLVVGSLAWGLVSSGSSTGPAPSIRPDAMPSTAQDADASSAPLAALPPPIPDVVSGDMQAALLDRGFECITHDLAAEGRSHVECSKGAEYVVSWRGRGPTSVHYVRATVTGVSESYAASFVNVLFHVCAPGHEAWAYSNIHTGGEETFGLVRVRLTAVAEDTWLIEIMGA